MSRVFRLVIFKNCEGVFEVLGVLEFVVVLEVHEMIHSSLLSILIWTGDWVIACVGWWVGKRICLTINLTSAFV